MEAETKGREGERGWKRGMRGHCVHGAPAIMCQKNDTKIINKYIHGTTWAIRRGNSLWVIFPHAFRLFFHCATLPPLFLPPALPVPFGNHFSIARAIYHRRRSQPHRSPHNAHNATQIDDPRIHDWVILESSRRSIDRYATNPVRWPTCYFSPKSILIGRIFKIRPRD